MAIKPRGSGAMLSLIKRVPKRYESVEPRKLVWVSLHTDSMAIANGKAGLAWENMIAGWEAKLAGDTSDAEARFEAARELAAVRGFRYLDRAPDVSDRGTVAVMLALWQARISRALK